MVAHIVDGIIDKIPFFVGVVIIIAIGSLILSTADDTVTSTIAYDTVPLYPIDDISNAGVWGISDGENWYPDGLLWEKLTIPNIGGNQTIIGFDFITTGDFEVLLDTPTEIPLQDTRHVLIYSARDVIGNADSHNFNFVLYQGATPIASTPAINLTGELTEYSYTLTEDEAESITDYSDLRLRSVLTLSSVAQINIDYAYLDIPFGGWGAVNEDVQTSAQSGTALLTLVVIVLAAVVLLVAIRRLD